MNHGQLPFDGSLAAILFRCVGTYVLEACNWPLRLIFYLNDPPIAKLSDNYRRLPNKFSPFPILSTFRILCSWFVSPLSRFFFAASSNFIRYFKISKHTQNNQNPKINRRHKKKPPRKNPEKECFAKPANEPRPAALRRHNPPLTAMLFRCARTYILEVCSWPLKSILYTFQSEQISHDQLPFEGTIRFQLPCCFIVLWNVCFGGL